MKELFKNFEFWKDDNPENVRPFMVACKDLEAKDEERWVLASLFEEEARMLYEELKTYFG